MPAARNDDDQTDPGAAPGMVRDENFVKTLVVPQPGDYGFDFEAFERSEAEAAARVPKKADPAAPPERAPERRTILPRNWLPPGDSVVETRPVGNMTVVSLRGRINESFRGAELGQSLSGVVVFDLSQVDRISSFGVKGWLQMLEHARFTHCYFFRCSEAVINQITMMRNFCGTGRIHSLLVPYLCGGCGEEFSAVYDAVADREAILGRSPGTVECPRCAAGAKIADDPWAYLAVDDHLLDHVPADLEQVVEHLTQVQRVDPIEKFVSDDETRVRINVPLDARLRLGRALNGLEGRVVFDLTPRPELSADGIHRLLDAIRELEPEVTEVWIDGATRSLIEALLAEPTPRTFVSTAWVTAVATDTGIRRPVLVDLRKKRASLLRGEMPTVDAGWARGAVRFDDADVVFTAARHLVPHTPHAPTPNPAPIGHNSPSPAPAPNTGAYNTSGYNTGPYQPYTTGSYRAVPTGGTPPPRSARSDASIPGLQITTTTPRPAYPRTTMLIWQVLAFVAVTLLLAAMAFTVVFWVAYRAFGSGGLVAEGSRVLPSVSVGIEEGWDGGSPLPPAWTEQPVAVDELSVRGAGSGRGETAEFAAERSRQVAVYHLVQYLAQQLQATPVAAALGADPGEGGAEAVSDQFLADVGAWATPERVNQAVKRDATGYTVATQHQLDRTIVQRTVEFYAQTQEFRGLRVGRRFPFRGSSSSGVVVVRAESWFKGVSPGDTLFEIGDQPVTTLDDFVRIATASWRDTAEGGSLGMWVEHDGQRSRIDFVRPSATKRETKIELLPLELPR